MELLSVIIYFMSLFVNNVNVLIRKVQKRKYTTTAKSRTRVHTHTHTAYDFKSIREEEFLSFGGP